MLASRPNATISSLAIEDITQSIQTTLSFDPDWSPYALMNKNFDHPLSTVAFQHFIKASTETVVVPAIRNVMRTDMIRVAFTVSTIPNLKILYTDILIQHEERPSNVHHPWCRHAPL